MINFKIVESDDQVIDTANLAKEIWNEYFVPMIGREQVDYMLEHMQSFGPMKQQIESGYKYYLIEKSTQPVGYLCIKPDRTKLFLSKLYLLKASRGEGIGRQALQFIEHFAAENHIKKIWLTVNKGNNHTIESYHKWGFKIVGEPVAEIGGGFVMDD